MVLLQSRQRTDLAGAAPALQHRPGRSRSRPGESAARRPVRDAGHPTVSFVAWNRLARSLAALGGYRQGARVVSGPGPDGTAADHAVRLLADDPASGRYAGPMAPDRGWKGENADGVR